MKQSDVNELKQRIIVLEQEVADLTKQNQGMTQQLEKTLDLVTLQQHLRDLKRDMDLNRRRPQDDCRLLALQVAIGTLLLKAEGIL